MKLKSIALIAALAFATTAHAQTEDQLAWANVPGNWSGKFHLDENDCRWTVPPKQSLKVKAKLRAATGYEDPEDGSLLAGKFGDLRFQGYWFGVDDEEGQSASFWRNTPIRMTNGWTCRKDTEINFLDYWGGDWSDAEMVVAIICRGVTICETRYTGTFKKGKK